MTSQQWLPMGTQWVQYENSLEAEMDQAENVRAVWDTDELRGLWNKAREVLESPDRPATFRLELPDDATRKAVSDLYGRPMWGQGTRINVSKLDAALRETPFGLGLEQVLEILHGRPVTRSEPSEAEPDHAIGTLRSALAEHGLSEARWAAAWTQWVQQYGRVADDDLDRLARRAAAVLAQLVLDPGRSPRAWDSRADLASRFGGGAYELDNGTALSRLVLRGAAMAHNTDAPSNERERRALWERCGVTLDAVSATVLCWALPVTGQDAWSEAIRQRTSAGLPAHLTHLDLRHAPQRPVDPGTAVAICESPRVLEAAARENIAHPLICVSGHPTTATDELLRRLSSSGAALHYHGDFDWPGIAIARSVWENHGASLWRMSAADYREAVNLASAERIDLPSLVGEPADTPWDPELTDLMATAGRAVEEETVLPTLLTDLRAGL